MKIFTYDINGASPGPGTLVVIAPTLAKANRLADKAIEENNDERRLRGWDEIERGEVKVFPIHLPAVVYFYDGER